MHSSLGRFAVGFSFLRHFTVLVTCSRDGDDVLFDGFHKASAIGKNDRSDNQSAAKSFKEPSRTSASGKQRRGSNPNMTEPSDSESAASPASQSGAAEAAAVTNRPCKRPCVNAASTTALQAAGTGATAHAGGHNLKETISIVTWNLRKFKVKTSGPKRRSIESSLTSYIREIGAQVLVLQEVQSCSALSLFSGPEHGFGCVEQSGSGLYKVGKSVFVTGNVILYDTSLFEAEGQNAYALEDVLREEDKHNISLESYHIITCSWEDLDGGKGCGSAQKDILKPTSLLLRLKTTRWLGRTLKYFRSGVRIINIHLFSGARRSEISPLDKEARRQFQMRSIFALNQHWNNELADAAAPTTIFAGDFNTQSKTQLKTVLSSAADYFGVNLKCPGNVGQLCDGDALFDTSAFGNAEYLDNIVVDLRGLGKIWTVATSLSQETNANESTALDKKSLSDHNPLFVSLV